jgi:hypothetical protein
LGVESGKLMKINKLQSKVLQNKKLAELAELAGLAALSGVCEPTRTSATREHPRCFCFYKEVYRIGGNNRQSCAKTYLIEEKRDVELWRRRRLDMGGPVASSTPKRAGC